ncbi:MAG TPA: SDR family NAD(P)-dependent oxidoreductase [Pseudogracilibacillus sp.]|nr:SDR family NAD(P)-dependent oxidoreductase [Pseudogracilibacillus sp.]
MQERVAIVTGGSSGLGEAIAEDFLRNGMKVVITGRNEDRLNEAKSRMENISEHIWPIAMDVSKKEEIDNTVKQVLKRWGRIDILVNNAGVRLETPVEDITVEEWDMILDINLAGTFFFSQAVIATMRKNKWGRIINMSSYGGQAGPLTSGAHYCASKAGQLALTKSFARSLAEDGITVNAITPAAVRTPEMDNIEPDKLARMEQSIPVKRFGKSIEVAKMTSYLASEEAGYVTGATFDINGGLLMR